jgi:HlyD family secretion protein
VRQAEAVLTGATTALKHATDLRENPQELDAQISAARAQLKTAAAGVDAARAALSAARVLQESLPNPGSDEDRTRRAIYDQQVNAAQATLRAAQAQERGVQAVLAQLLTIREKPVGLEAAVHRGEGEVAVAQAGVGVARAVLAQVRAPTQPEAVAQTQAKVGQAEAALAQVETAIARLSVRSPAAGRITAQNVHAGEVAQPGAALFTVADLRRVKLVIYVPTSQIGQVRLGQSAEVTVDAYPERRFTGTVVHVADQAEFTPRNVQTAEERVKTVFAVEIALDNSAGLLRPGLPADAVLKP